MSYENRENIKRYFQVLVYLTGIIIFWRGLWDLAAQTPYIENPYVSMVVGLLILTLSGYIYYEAAFMRKGTHRYNTLKAAVEQARGEKGWTLKYYDDLSEEDKTVRATYIHKIEKSTIVLRKGNREEFVPLHRLTLIKDKNRIVWKH
jgi:hypothetical protein